MRNGGMGEIEIAAALHEANTTRCKPPLEADEVDALAADVSERYDPDPRAIARAAREASAPPPCLPNVHGYNDIGNSDRVVMQHSARLKWIEDWNMFAVWNDTRWERGKAAAVGLAKATMRSIISEANAIDDDAQRALALKWAASSAHRSRVDNSLALAKPDVNTDPGVFDSNAYLFNVANGIIDLRTGALGPHDPAAMMTKLSPVDYHPGRRHSRHAGRSTVA